MLRCRAGPQRADLPRRPRCDELTPHGVDVPPGRNSSRGFPHLRESVDELASARIRGDPAPDLLRLLSGAFPGDVPGESGTVYAVVEHGGDLRPGARSPL